MGASQSIVRASSYAFPFTRSAIFTKSKNKIPKVIVPSSAKLFSSQSLSKPVDYPKELDILKPIGQIYINQTKVISRGISLKLLGATSTVELNAVSKKGTILFRLLYTRGERPEEHKIDVFGVGHNKPHLADMDLERSAQYKGFILCVKSPPGNLLCQVYELRGISQIAIAKNYKTGETMFQILMNGEFGWAESAQILTARSDRKVGRLYKRHVKGAMLRNTLDAAIHMPTDFSVAAKLTLIGTCLHLMGRYHN